MNYISCVNIVLKNSHLSILKHSYSFFKHLSDNYFKYLKTQAKKLIVEETMDKISDLKNSLDLLNSKVESLSDNIDYDMRIIKRVENEGD